MSPQYGELRPTSGWDRFVSLGHLSKFQRVWRLGSVIARHSSSGRQPNFAALNRGRHLYSAGRPSRWALAHILVRSVLFSSVLFLSRPESEAWPHHGRTFSIYLYPLSFWLTLPQRVLSTSWRCLSRPCVVFLACMHLALFFAVHVVTLNGSILSANW